MQVWRFLFHASLEVSGCTESLQWMVFHSEDVYLMGPFFVCPFYPQTPHAVIGWCSDQVGSQRSDRVLKLTIQFLKVIVLTMIGRRHALIREWRSRRRGLAPPTRSPATAGAVKAVHFLLHVSFPFDDYPCHKNDPPASVSSSRNKSGLILSSIAHLNLRKTNTNPTALASRNT